MAARPSTSSPSSASSPEPVEPSGSDDRQAAIDVRPLLAPPFYVADVPLPVGAEMGGAAAPARAFNPGDRVPAEHVERFGWQTFVHAPDGDWPAPAAVPAAADPSDSGTAGTGE